MYKLSPSDLTFLWDSCKYCFYLKVKHNIVYRGAFPSIFGKMTNLTSNFYQDKPTSEISLDLPPGTMKLKEKYVTSAPIPISGSSAQAYIRGRFDAVIEFEDGSYGVLDYKTSDAKDEHAAFYSGQLSAYAYALENPAPNALHISPVSRLGLFVVTPERFEMSMNGDTVFVNKTTWVEVQRDDEAFLSLIGEILAILEAPTPPESAKGCPACNYRTSIQDFDAQAR
jgi:CRISPR/Cas system-associated exonuclease Cas4 (RecB family)